MPDKSRKNTVFAKYGLLKAKNFSLMLAKALEILIVIRL